MAQYCGLFCSGSVVLAHDERGWRTPTRFHELFDLAKDSPLWRFIPSFDVVVDDIRKVDDEALRARDLPTAAAVTLWLTRDARSDRLLATLSVDWAAAALLGSLAAVAARPPSEDRRSHLAAALGPRARPNRQG